VPERQGPLLEEAAAGGFTSNRAWAVAELRGLGRVNRALQAVLLQVGRARGRAGGQAGTACEHVRLRARAGISSSGPTLTPCVAADPTAQVMPRGVAFHHADLSSEQRALVERAFSSGAWPEPGESACAPWRGAAARALLLPGPGTSLTDHAPPSHLLPARRRLRADGDVHARGGRQPASAARRVPPALHRAVRQPHRPHALPPDGGRRLRWWRQGHRWGAGAGGRAAPARSSTADRGGWAHHALPGPRPPALPGGPRRPRRHRLLRRGHHAGGRRHQEQPAAAHHGEEGGRGEREGHSLARQQPAGPDLHADPRRRPPPPLLPPPLQRPPEPIESCLKAPDKAHKGRPGMRRIILEAVAVSAVATAQDMDRFVRCARAARRPGLAYSAAAAQAPGNCACTAAPRCLQPTPLSPLCPPQVHAAQCRQPRGLQRRAGVDDRGAAPAVPAALHRVSGREGGERAGASGMASSGVGLRFAAPSCARPDPQPPALAPPPPAPRQVARPRPGVRGPATGQGDRRHRQRARP
jgi:hypothetical protein